MIDQYKKLLAQFVNFKTVSTDPNFKEEMERCVVWLKDLFEKNSFRVEVWPPFAKASEGQAKNNPVVLASYDAGAKETILIYGHYDVQPADDFKLTEKDGRFYGRGVADNKGQTLIHIVTAFELINEKKLGYNIKFLLEGDEESGNEELESLIKIHKEKLQADLIMISDGEIDGESPCLEISLRGGFNVTLKFKTGETDLHSGTYGKKIYNAPHELAKFLAHLKVGKTETLMSTIQVSGIKSGYVGEGYANIIPATAEARLNFRVAAPEDSKEVWENFQKYVKKIVPTGVEYELSAQGIHQPVRLNVESEKIKNLERHLEKSHGNKVLHKDVGGAIPIVTAFQDILKTEIALVPLANNDCNMHGSNENFKIDLVSKGLDFSRRLLS